MAPTQTADPAFSDDDRLYMQTALSLARRGLGSAYPNPAVGCVLVRSDEVVGRGWTAAGGRPHAEAEALRMAGDRAAGATAYVTLEPCSHEGKSPPCAAALIGAGIERTVYAIEDPNPKVAGQGAAMLGDAGIRVEAGLMEAEAAEINAGFFLKVRDNRPLVTLKFATSADGRIPAADAKSPWITGLAARDRGHILRADHDAILVGAGTVIADDPSLTCRSPGLSGRSPVRIVLCGADPLPPGARVLTDGAAPTWVIGPSEQDDGLPDDVRHIDAADSRDLKSVLSLLAGEGITRLLVEGGPGVHTSFVAAGFADRVAWFHSERALGGAGRPALDDRELAGYLESGRFRTVGSERLGDDQLEMLAAKE